MLKKERCEAARLAEEEIEVKHVTTLLRSLINSETGNKRNTHIRSIVVLTAKARYSKSGSGDDLGLELGPTIAIALRFQAQEWKLLSKHWESVPNDLQASVRAIPFDIACWHKYLGCFGKEHPILSAQAALEGALIVARQNRGVISSRFDAVLGHDKDTVQRSPSSPSPGRNPGPSTILAAPNKSAMGEETRRTKRRKTSHPVPAIHDDMHTIPNSTPSKPTQSSPSESNTAYKHQHSLSPKNTLCPWFVNLPKYERELLHIFDHRILRSRTLLKTSSYDDLFSLAGTNSKILPAIFAVASIYARKDSECSHYKMLAVQSLSDSCRELRFDRLMLDGLMLIVHASVVRGNTMWIKTTRKILLKNQIPRSPSLMFLMYQLILCIFSPLAIQGLDISWLYSSPQADVVLDLGLSPRLLHCIGAITQIARGHPDDHDVKQHLQYKQMVSGVEDEGRKVTEHIAESYLLSAHLLIDCRLLGYTKNHPQVASRALQLKALLEVLPLEGDMYRAIDPLFCRVLCAMLRGPGAVKISPDALAEGVNNIKPTESLLKAVWDWQEQNIACEEKQLWFEDMVKSLPENLQNVSLG